MVYADLGLTEEAARSAERYRDEAPYPAEDIYFGSDVARLSAQVLARSGSRRTPLASCGPTRGEGGGLP